MDEMIAFVLTVLAGALVSMATLWLAARQRAEDERRAEGRRRDVVLNALGRELRWNRGATRGNSEVRDATNAHVRVGALTTVAFERYGADLATIVPDSVELVFEHYGMVGRVREGIRALGPPESQRDDATRRQWIQVCDEARVDVTNFATKALESLARRAGDRV